MGNNKDEIGVNEISKIKKKNKGIMGQEKKLLRLIKKNMIMK